MGRREEIKAAAEAFARNEVSSCGTGDATTDAQLHTFGAGGFIAGALWADQRNAGEVTLDDACPHCGEAYDREEADHVVKHGPLECSRCGREGCSECMPAGQGVPCPECEDDEELGRR